jgi:hypothetical protein
MRYYSIKLLNPPAVFKPVQGASIFGAQWDSWINGQNDPGAQQIEFSIEEQEAAAPTENSTIIIRGVPWEQITEAAPLINTFIEFHAGMKPGLPLATAQVQPETLICTARIIKAWGNWEGTEMSIGMMLAVGMQEKNQQQSSNGGDGAQQIASAAESAIGGGGGDGGSAPAMLKYMKQIQKAKYRRTGRRSIDRRVFPRGPTVGTRDVGGGFDQSGFGVFQGLAGGLFGGGSGDGGLSGPLNLAHNMLPNMPLSSAIQETLGRAFPQANINTAIHSGLKLPYQDAGIYQTMSQYAGYLKNLSHSIMGAKGYGGLKMSSHDNNINVWDGTQPPINEGLISVIDLVGQPTWVDQFLVHIKTVLRADLHIGDVITLPSNILMALGPNANVIGANGPASPQRSNLSFHGSFRITKITHVGDFRSPHGSDWTTNYECSVETEDGGVLTQGSNAIDSSSQQQNSNNAPVNNNPPPPPIEGGQQPGFDTAPTPQIMMWPSSRLNAKSTGFGSVYRRGKARRYG